ncbi:ABC transporter permease [Actinacidiphila bryophytorum]|uniref:ABC transporter permease n=1 Tax=Actinacidiphila bryophytorum TaxID=1436133 RepID=A0A9W4MFP1_9ACTN|nr:ABC transporter permease [Actinacidiphila bryophytorum]MBM9435128.1 ABC transporter permease [Actinacidiphila bryophytorum]MBN6544882.1 ABC transporter permease [Actinacidiphila bryophytorum]CAG7643311.1 ABC transporter permease [Actinacidiphila bryophytorum]
MSAPAGSATLTRLALRRDRVMIPGWIYALAATAVGSAVSYRSLYADQADRTDFQRSTNASGPLRAFYGPIYDAHSVGALTAWRIGVIGAALAGLMSILLVVRHTREEEETGRQEMLGATMVDRRAPLTAALTATAAADAVVALVVAAGMAVLGESPAGSVALGLQLAAGGLAFGAVAAVTAQLTASARLARGLAGTVLGAAFLLRAAGDAGSTGGSSPLVWASPLGWLEHLHPYAGESWWVLAPVAGFAALCCAAAYALVERRDIGASLLPARPGPAGAGRLLRGPSGLAWRLQRGSLYGWGAGLLVAGAVYGSVTDSVGDIVGDNGQVGDIIERMGGHTGLTDAFLATVMGVYGIAAGGYAVQSLLRLRAEESAGGAEALLAHPVGRLRWAAGHLAHALLGPVLLLAAAGAATGLAYGLAVHDVGGQLPRLTGAAVGQAPAVWVLVGLGVLLFGLRPRAASAAWGLLAACVLLGQLGPVLRLPQPVLDVSPFTHLPDLPGSHVAATPYAWLILVAAAALAAGLAGLRRRDLTS